MPRSEWELDRDGFCILPRAVDTAVVERLFVLFDQAFADQSQSVLARSSRGHVYAWNRESSLSKGLRFTSGFTCNHSLRISTYTLRKSTV